MEENNKEITLAKLAKKLDEMSNKIDDVRTELTGKIDGVRTELNTKIDSVIAVQWALSSKMSKVQGDLQDLKKGALTEEQKTDLITMVRAYDDRLVAEALGKSGEKGNVITLTREEYDTITTKLDIPNRYIKLRAA